LRKKPGRNEISRAPCSFHHLLSLGEIFSAIYIAVIENLKGKKYEGHLLHFSLQRKAGFAKIIYNFLKFVATKKKIWQQFFFHHSLLLLFLDPGSEILDPGSMMGKNQDPG